MAALRRLQFNRAQAAERPWPQACARRRAARQANGWISRWPRHLPMNDKHPPKISTPTPYYKPAAAAPPEAQKPPARTRSTVLASSDAVLSYELTRDRAGVCVKSVHQRCDGSRSSCSAMFQTEQSFAAWLQANRIAAEYPAMFDQLKRNFNELMAQGGEA